MFTRYGIAFNGTVSPFFADISDINHHLVILPPCSTVADGDEDSVPHAVVVEPGRCKI